MEKSRIRLVALDLDGTALRPDGTLSPRTRAALVRAARCGIEIVVASGRSYASLPGEVLGIRGIRYAVTSNGAAVNAVPGGRRLWEKCLPPGAVEQILEVARGGQAALETFVDGVPYADRSYTEDPVRWGCPARAVGYVRETRKPVPDIFAFLTENKEHLDSIDFVCGEEPVRRRLAEQVAARVPGVYLTSSVPHLLEISAAGGKGEGLRTVCGLAGIRLEETASCGNADNDADMLRISRVGAAVADATPGCLAAADVVIRTNCEDGVAEFLEWICEGDGAVTLPLNREAFLR